MAENKQYQIKQKGGPWELVSKPMPVPQGDDVVVEMKAVALNPLDWKQYYFGAMIQSWPAVIGCDGAGIVAAVGPAVNTFKVGDQVFGALLGHPNGGAYQQFATIKERALAKKPAGLSFEDAASMPVCYWTAAAAILDLKVPLPFLEGGATTGFQPRSVLVLGGSSSVGSQVIEILRLALPSATILTTCSSKHHQHAVSLGATKAFDYNAASLIDDVKNATPDGKGVDAIIDAVAAASSMPSIFNVLTPDGSKEYIQVVTGDEVKAPDGVNHRPSFGASALKHQGGENLMNALAKLLNDGQYKLPIPTKVVGSGFDAIGKGIDELKSGVSGLKLIVSL